MDLLLQWLYTEMGATAWHVTSLNTVPHQCRLAWNSTCDCCCNDCTHSNIPTVPL